MVLFPRNKYLTLHGVGAPPSDVSPSDRPYWVALPVFERMMARLAETERQHGVAIHVTSDDGFASDYHHIMPRLAALGRTGHFFPIGRRIGADGCVSASQLRAMAAAGMDIGAHGDAHVNWRQLDNAAVTADLTAAKLRLEALLGRTVASVSVPFGAFDHRVIELARAAGFTRIFTSAGGFATADSGLIPRTTVKGSFDPDRDLARLVGAPARLRSAVIDRVRRWRHTG